MLENTIKSVPQMLSRLTELGKSHKLWYRGETREHLHMKLVPSVLRKDAKGEYFYNEKEIINEFFTEFPHWAAHGNGVGHANHGHGHRLGFDPDYLSYMQHYGFPTRLLEWSVSPLIALYFACESRQQDAGKVFCLKYVEVNKLSIKNADRELFSCYGAHPLIRARFDLATNNNVPNVKRNHRYPIAVRFPMSNERIKSRLGRFTMHGGLQYGKADLSHLHFTNDDMLKETVVELTIPADAKAGIMADLKTLGFSAHVLYRDDPARLRQTLQHQNI